MNITTIIDSKPVEIPPDNIYHLPSPLTHLQKCLVEVLLNLHRPHLMRMIESTGAVKQKTTNTDNLNDEQMLELLAHNWQSILGHPFLLVDHFVPKKLILMESSPNLIKDSGKFKQFDDLINKLENFKYNVIVVASAIKEIDLIEGYLLGRRLNYKRYTGASLYDINTYQESSAKMSYSNSTSNLHRRKRTGDYISKMSKNNLQFQFMQKNPKEKLTLHLISSNQIKTMNFNENLKFDFIISFDPMLSNLVYLRQTRSADGNLIPMVKLVVFNSIEHYQLLGEKDLPKIIFQSLINRDTNYQFETDVKWIQSYSKVNWGVDLNTPVKQYNRDELLNSLNKQISQGPKKLKLETIDTELTLKEYKHLLTKSIKENIAQVTEWIITENTKLDPMRAKDTSIQLEIETKNLQIAELVKSKQALEVELNALSKRVERLDADLTKISLLKTTKSEILNEEIEDEIEIDEKELEEWNSVNEQTRSDYQLNSSKALETSVKLNIVTSENAKLKAKLDDNSYIQLNEQLVKVNDYNQQYVIEKLSRENKFLVDYNNKINNIVRNNSIFDSNNGRSGNGRLSRSTTPRI